MRAACFLAPAIFFLAAAQSVFSTEAAHKAAIESFEEPFAIDAVRRSAVIQIHAKPFAHSSHSHSHPLRTRPISKTKKQSSFLGLSLQEVNAPVYSTGGRNLVGQVSKGLQDLGIVAQECFSSYIPSAGKTTESKTPAHKNRPTMEPSKAAAITSCSDTLTPHAKASDPFWIESIKHEGIVGLFLPTKPFYLRRALLTPDGAYRNHQSAFNANPSTYRVFRNVKDFGA